MAVISLTPRLQTVADLVPAQCTFADVGTDHAYLPVWLIQQGVIDTAIASDLREGPLAHAKSTVRQFGYMDRFQFRLSDGLAAYTAHEADCIAIAGMGGEAIRSILSAAPWTKTDTRLILQPQSNLPELRLWLTGSGYRIQSQRCVREGERWYSVLLVTGGDDPTVWTPGTLLVGDPSRWEEDADWAGYLAFQQSRLERQIDGLRTAAQPDQLRLDQLLLARTELFNLQQKWGRTEHANRERNL